MNKTLRDLIIFTIGAAAGSIGTYLAVKKTYELKADLEIEEVKRVYEEKVNEFEEHKSSISGELEGPSEIEESKVKSISEIMNNKMDIKDYTKFFKAKGETISGVGEVLRDAHEEIEKEIAREDVDPSELERPEDDEAYSDEEDRQQTIDYIDYELNGASREANLDGKEPYVIDASDFELTCKQYEKIDLNYYISDDVLVGDDLEIIDDASHLRLIGDILTESGFDSNEDDVLYVRNDKIMCDFEITKIFTAFTGE